MHRLIKAAHWLQKNKKWNQKTRVYNFYSSATASPATWSSSLSASSWSPSSSSFPLLVLATRDFFSQDQSPQAGVSPKEESLWRPSCSYRRISISAGGKMSLRYKDIIFICIRFHHTPCKTCKHLFKMFLFSYLCLHLSLAYFLGIAKLS